MTAAASNPPPSETLASFEIKSANLPLVALRLQSPDMEALARDMAQRFGDIPDFFEHDPLVIDLSPLEVPAFADAAIDFNILLTLLRRYQLVPIAFKGGTPALVQAALAAGLTAAADAQVLQAKTQPSAGEASPHAQVLAPLAATPVQSPMPNLGALIVDKPLRSGQQVYARGRDLVVLAMVNPGAEVIADGSIHVYASLRGRAIAGARGNVDARIFALALDAELLSIAGVYRTSDTPLPEDVQGKPAQVRLASSADGDKLVMDALIR